MRPRRRFSPRDLSSPFFFVAVLCCFAAAWPLAPTGGAAAATTPADAVPPFRVSTFKPREERAAATAYADVRRVLGEDNSCSRFFGPREMSAHVLAQLFASLRGEVLKDRSIGIRMSGDYQNITSLANQFSYRIFKDAVINRHGPFFHAMRAGRLELSRVGSFPANSREARALMLLHELGHLIKGADGRWLLNDESGDAYVGDRNTRLIESKCLKQLTRLRDERPLVS